MASIFIFSLLLWIDLSSCIFFSLVSDSCIHRLFPQWAAPRAPLIHFYCSLSPVWTFLLEPHLELLALLLVCRGPALPFPRRTGRRCGAFELEMENSSPWNFPPYLETLLCQGVPVSGHSTVLSAYLGVIWSQWRENGPEWNMEVLRNCVWCNSGIFYMQLPLIHGPCLASRCCFIVMLRPSNTPRPSFSQSGSRINQAEWHVALHFFLSTTDTALAWGVHPVAA